MKVGVVHRVKGPTSAAAWLLLVVSALSTAWPAHAADCQMTLSEPELDFGKIDRKAVDQRIGARTLSLTLACTEEVDLTVLYRAEGGGQDVFAFGEKGAYSLLMRDARVDGQVVDLGRVAAAGQAPMDVSTVQALLPDRGVVPVMAGQQIRRGRTLTARVEVVASVRQRLYSLRDATSWQASGLFDAPVASVSRSLGLRAEVVPGACVPTLSNRGVVDLGRYAPSQLNALTPTALAPKSIQLTVQCDAPTLFALAMQDAREGTSTVDSAYFYGLGLSGASNKIGTYSVMVDPGKFTADAIPTLYRTDSTTGGVAWSTSRSESAKVSSTGLVGFTSNAGDGSGPVPIQSLSGTLSVEAVIAPTDSLDIRNVINIDGLATFEIVYL